MNILTVNLLFSAFAFWLAAGLALTDSQSLCIEALKSALALSSLASSQGEKKPEPRDLYAGDQECGFCHKDKLDSFVRTAHHLTSQQPTVDTIAGSFRPDANILKTSNPALFFRMDAKDGRFYQTAVWGIPPSTSDETQPIDIVVGSGRKGQSYLYWRGDRLFQLPVSYWSEPGAWDNSPGYTDGDASFDRPVMTRCLECHASYAESLVQSPMNNRYRRNSLELGVTCERCHGPGREHVTRHRSANSTGAAAETIVNPAKLPRDRDVEVCAQCHAGMRWPIAPAFSYVPGEPLDQYLDRDRTDPNSEVDVHGGTVAHLSRSRCFQSSETLRCWTCHKIHQPQRNAAAFSDRCLTCHKPTDCGMSAELGPKIADNCIDCHMPVQQSKAIVTNSKGKQIRARVRNHWIKVYPGSSHGTGQ
jgi:hypothetical protein